MAESIKLTTEGMLLNWLKVVGDKVSTGDVIAEIEADKATVEVEATTDGVILELKAEPGEELAEGTVIATIGEEGESAGSDDAKAEESDEEEEKEAAPEKQAEGSNGASGGSAPAREADSGSNGTVAATTPDGRIKASPVARKMAEDRGIELGQIKGSGPDGRIVKADVENFKPGEASAKTSAKPAAPAASGPGTQATYGAVPADDVEVEDINRMRRRIADNTILSKQQIPHFYVTVEIDVEPMLALRKELNASLESEGIKISVNDMIMKACALALRKFPNLNSHYYGDKIVRHKRVNIGVSVALPNNGLVNVVSPDTDRKALSVLATENKAMYERAREGKIKPDDVKGATFTISNLGPYNVEHFLAIIAPPEAAILAVGSAMKVPIVTEDGTLSVGSRMKATISIDHRVSDGAEGAEFLSEVRNLLENPMRLVV